MMLALLASAARHASLAAQTVARGPHTLAPPSFEGQGWLIVLSLTGFTAGFVLLSTVTVWLLEQVARYWHVDRWRDPASIYRRIGICICAGFALRCFGEAYSLWAWDPSDPAATALALRVKRYVDPVAAGIGGTGVVLYVLSLRGMIPQLRKRPFPINMWASLPMLRRPAIVVAITLVGAIGVTVTR